MGIQQTRQWIAQRHPEFSEREITLEYVRIIHYESGEMKEVHWKHFEKVMRERIRKDWIQRFRGMMQAKG